SYLRNVAAKDPSVEAGKPLVAVCQKRGWSEFRPEIEAVFGATSAETLHRNGRVLEALCLAKPRKMAGWRELVEAVARAYVAALERRDKAPVEGHYRPRSAERSGLLAGLVRALTASGQVGLLDRVVSHALATPAVYPLATHVSVLTALRTWLGEHLTAPCPP